MIHVIFFQAPPIERQPRKCWLYWRENLQMAKRNQNLANRVCSKWRHSPGKAPNVTSCPPIHPATRRKWFNNNSRPHNPRSVVNLISNLRKKVFFSEIVFLAQGHSNGTNQDSRSEATSVCGDNSSVLSGFSGAVQSNTVATSKQAAVNASVAEQVSKRDSASSVVNKNTENGNIYLEHPPPVPPKDELETSTKEW